MQFLADRSMERHYVSNDGYQSGRRFGRRESEFRSEKQRNGGYIVRRVALLLETAVR